MTIELVDENDISSCKRQRQKNYELLEYLKKFEREEGRPPKAEDFRNNPKYPGLTTYIRHFGSWNSALKMAGLQAKKGGTKVYTDKELLEFLRKFERENGRPPIEEDFVRNYEYPNFQTYIKRFGSWKNALKLVCLDTDSMVKKGILETNQQKARLAEIFVLEHFVEKAVDLSGENSQSPYDGICPKNQIYDVKSSAFDGDHWSFALRNTLREEIEWFYLLGFDKGWTKPEFVLRIPGSLTDEDYMYIGLGSNYTYNLENMREYEITEKFKDIDLHLLNENSEEKKEKELDPRL
mgnify:CR=1 FL=1